jgi:hypothetical protein
MKKLIIIILASFFCLASCNRAPDNAGGTTSDAKVGGSLSVDSLKTSSSAISSPKAKSLDSIDTMNKIKPSAFPVTDTAKKKIP